ncbi:MAG: nucleoside recognition domain-containing protein [bacterium]|nr:nucleoside recognition domain-containing protein [bacterium]
MINYIWGFLVLVSIIFGAINGRIGEVSKAVYTGGTTAVELCVSLTAVMGVWGGFIKIAEAGGMTNVIGKILSPIVRLLFRNLNKNDEAVGAISMSMAANLLGLGNAATPLGIEAMKKINKVNPLKSTASYDMITFVVINTASIQLVPTTIGAIRAKFGAENPLDINSAVIITSLLSLAVGLILNEFCHRFFKRKTGGE